MGKFSSRFLDTPQLAAVVHFSADLFSDIALSGLPVLKYVGPLGDTLSALVENVFVPSGDSIDSGLRLKSSQSNSIAESFSRRVISFKGKRVDINRSISQRCPREP